MWFETLYLLLFCVTKIETFCIGFVGVNFASRSKLIERTRQNTGALKIHLYSVTVKLFTNTNWGIMEAAQSITILRCLN